MYRAHVHIPGTAYDADQKRIRNYRTRKFLYTCVTETIAAVGMVLLFVLIVPFLLCICPA